VVGLPKRALTRELREAPTTQNVPTVMTTARTIATTAWAAVWAPTRQRAQPTSATSGGSTSRSGPKSSTTAVTLPAMPPRCRLTFHRRPCVIVMAITTPMTSEATVASSARDACHDSRFAERRFYAAVYIFQIEPDDRFDDSPARKRRTFGDIDERADAPASGDSGLGASPRTSADGRRGVRLSPISTRPALNFPGLGVMFVEAIDDNARTRVETASPSSTHPSAGRSQGDVIRAGQSAHGVAGNGGSWSACAWPLHIIHPPPARWVI
jgi:hypothetical protein